MRLLPQSLFSRMVLILVGGLILVQSLSVDIHLRERDRMLFRASSMVAAQRIVDAVKLLDSLNPAERHKVVAALDAPTLRIFLGAAPVSTPQKNLDSKNRSTDFSAMLRGLLGENRLIEVSAHETEQQSGQAEIDAFPDHSPPGISFTVRTRLQDGTWVSFDSRLTGDAIPIPHRLLLNLLILLASVTFLSLIAVRLATRPLFTLATAAEELGKNINSPPLTEKGPTEVRRAAHAFNTMQSRLVRYIQDRTRILAAMSHDLKTPITRLRLRAELLDDADLKTKFDKDLQEMESMVATTLDFMRGVDSQEPMQPVDIMALLESIQADGEEMGQEIHIQGTTLRPYLGAPSALKRCLGNLIDNAVKYGMRADIAVSDSKEELEIRIRDDGPGIPEAQLERVFEPFFRLEESRSRDTGGTGLGLSIARNIAQAHGGELVLRNLAAGGLEAVLTLPRAG